MTPNNRQPNIEAKANICLETFQIKKYINTGVGSEGWRVPCATVIHMQIVDLKTGKFVPLRLLPMYFGLPVLGANGEFYSPERAAEIAAAAVEEAETAVMDRYKAIGGSVDIIGMSLLYRNNMNEYMQEFGNSATRSPGHNISVADFGKAKYSWPIIGCL